MQQGFQNVKVIYDPAVSLEQLTQAYVMQAMEHHKGNKAKVAIALGITLRTLYNWFHEWDFDFRGQGWVKGSAHSGGPYTIVSVADYNLWRERSGV